MLTASQEKLIRSLKIKKARQAEGLCLVEGEKVVAEAKKFVVFSFARNDSSKFDKLVTTETPQDQAAVAKIPIWSEEKIKKSRIIVVLDNVQDPGNVGSILRLCLGFGASLILVESADVTSPKVIRSSAGAIFKVPWQQISKQQAVNYIGELARPVYKLEKKPGAAKLNPKNIKLPAIIVAGSEGQGIKLKLKGQSIFINHNSELESLNVTHALAIALYLLNN